MIKCEICEKELKSKFALQAHARIHKEGYKFPEFKKVKCEITGEMVVEHYIEKYKKKLIKCKLENCNNIFNPKKGNKELFCSQSCSASFNNNLREPKSQEEKDKISLGLKEYYKNNPKPIGIRKLRDQKKLNRKICENTGKPIIEQICKNCFKIFEHIKIKKYCFSCNESYGEKRNHYKFSFNVYHYPELFNLKLLQEKGFFAPKGKSGRWNPTGLSRDHKVSVNEALEKNYDPFYISHPLNCELMTHEQNNKKKTKSSMSYDDLVKLVNDYEQSKLN